MTLVTRSLLLAASVAALGVIANLAISFKLPASISDRLGLTATATASTAIEEPAAAWRLEPIEGSKDIARVILSQKAVERLDVKTVAVRQENRSVRGRLLPADVLAPPAGTAPAGLVAQVAFSSTEDLKAVAGRSAMLYPSPVKATATAGVAAQPAEMPAWAKAPVDGRAAYLTLDAAAKDIKPGQHVWIEFAGATEAPRKIIPFSSVLYDADGNTWAYVATKPQTYERTAVAIEAIEGADAVLTAGGPAGAAVVTDGAVEIFGTEFKVGH